ncbi:MAG: hypothetical protein VYA51_10295 [Planctomycetota bacterium]|nr:hypothetical protein [Planctomycetota bacterium]
MSAPRKLSLIPLLLASCVAYEPSDVDVASIAEDLAARRGGAYTFEEAAVLTLRHHEELLAAEARARAAGAATTVPLPLLGEWRQRNEALGAMVDPVAMLGLGPRGAEVELADARADAAATELAVARWRSLAELAEAYELHRAAATLAAPELGDDHLDLDAFVRAGLASPVAVAMLRAARSRARAERVELARLRDDQLARIRHLLAVSPAATLEPLHTAEPICAEDHAAADLLTRPDIALAAARFEVADRELRKAVADQYPSFQIGPSFSLRGDPLRAMGMLKLPIGMQGLAEAARARRDATRHEVRDALVEAMLEAETANNEQQSAAAAQDTAAEMLAARRAAFHAARAALEVRPDAFQAYAAAASEYAQAVAEHRRAKVALTVAKVRLAVSYGWPHRDNMEVLP